MTSELEWVLLAYRLPREPSTPRIAVWRKLRRLGVAQLLDGLVALPADARTKEQLEWVADEVIEIGGQATVWIARTATAADERRLAAEMAEAVANDYRAVIDEAAQLASTGGTSARTLGRLRRQLERIDRRSFFPPPERNHARAAVRQLVAEKAKEGAAR